MTQPDFEQHLLMVIQNTAAASGIAENLEDFTFDLVPDYLQSEYVDGPQLPKEQV